MEISYTQQALSFVGAMMILVAYVGHQLKLMDSDRALYNVLNAIGSAILLWAALRPFQFGFVVLEAAWVLVSIYGWWRGRTVPST